jgi:hypothetical protein
MRDNNFPAATPTPFASVAAPSSFFVRIALVRPFSPEIGGGSAQLRSHLRYLPELDVQWYYLACRKLRKYHPSTNHGLGDVAFE